jgi:hypothetical protein
MSAAATAAGYLYASGRLRGRGAKGESEGQHPERPEAKPREKPERPAPRREVRVAVYAPEDKPRRTPKIQYRTRRWKPEAPNGE